MRKSIAIALLSIMVGCNWGSPTESSKAVPNVAGVYTGVINWDITYGTGYGRIASYRTTARVTQNNYAISIYMTLESLQLAPLTCKLTSTGEVAGCVSTAPASYYDWACGAVQGVDSSIVFDGNSMDYYELASTARCGNWSMSGALYR